MKMGTIARRGAMISDAAVRNCWQGSDGAAQDAAPLLFCRLVPRGL